MYVGTASMCLGTFDPPPGQGGRRCAPLQKGLCGVPPYKQDSAVCPATMPAATFIISTLFGNCKEYLDIFDHRKLSSNLTQGQRDRSEHEVQL